MADILGGSGFLAVYLAGLSLGSARIPARRTVAAFHDGLAWIAQIGMFFVLGLLVFPGELGAVALEGTVLALVLVFVARPVAVFVATAFERFSLAEKLTLGWAGLRGAVPVVLATFPVIEGTPHSQDFFNIVFFAVLFSTVLQGSTFEAIAQRLGVTTAQPALPRPLIETGTIRGLGAEVVEFPVRADDAIAGAAVRDLGLPRDALLNVIVRGEEAIPPRGSTRIQAGDRLHLLIRQEVSAFVIELTERWRTEPIAAPVRTRRTVSARRPILTVRPGLGRGWQRSASGCRRRRRGGAPDANQARHPRRARAARGRPLCDHRSAGRDRPARPAPAPHPPPAAPGSDGHRARLVAGGGRRGHSSSM